MNIIVSRKMTAIVLGALLAASLGFAIVCMAPKDAHAGSIPTSNGGSTYYVDLGKTYKKCDVTGDKKTDAVRVTLKKETLTVYVKGKKAFTKKNVSAYNANLIKLKNKIGYLHLQAYSKTGKTLISGLYQCVSGKLKCVVNDKKWASTKNLTSKVWGVSKVNGNKVTFYVYGLNKAKKARSASVTYTYKNNKLVKTGQTALKSMMG